MLTTIPLASSGPAAMLIVKDPTLLSATVSAYSARPVYPASWQDFHDPQPT
jgi:hypothetical protein